MSQPNAISGRADLRDFEDFRRGNACILWK